LRDVIVISTSEVGNETPLERGRVSGFVPLSASVTMEHGEHGVHYSVAERRWRLGLTALLGVYGWLCLKSPGEYRWLDSLDLAIHETGHLVFAFDGDTLAVLGGTLLQLIVPALFAVTLWRSGDRHGATVPLWWVAQNCWNISVYIKDARSEQLPLVGGGEHDWAMLLGQWGWLQRDQVLGGAVYLLGVILYVAAIIGGWMLLQRQRRPSLPVRS
jgi:hypothetical protein